MTVVDTRRPEVTDPKVILPSGASFSPLPGDAATLTETDYEGTWYRVIRGVCISNFNRVSTYLLRITEHGSWSGL